ncbi:MAG: ferrous iron transport protein A [Ekhidna sp.]|nr:ferrous iron transport protein A [Ekhidna sp.]
MLKLSAVKSFPVDCLVKSISDDELKDRLYEMGIFPGQSIRLLKKAPFGDPFMISVDDSYLMLRLNEADLISVEMVEKS